MGKADKKTKKKKRRRNKFRGKRDVRVPGDRGEDEPQRDNYTQLHYDKGGPGNPYAIPSSLRGISQHEEAYVAWVLANCKFAKGANDAEGAVEGRVVPCA